MKVTFGKHKGSDIKDIPLAYLEWGADKLKSHWQEEFEKELRRRRDEERKETDWIKANLDSPEAFKKLTNKFIAQFDKEMAESGCPWEYEKIDIFKEAEDMATKEIKFLRIEVEIEALKSKYQSLLGFDSEKMEKIEELFYSLKLSKNNFRDPSKYPVVLEYLHQLDEKKTAQTELFLDVLLNR